MNVLRKLAVIVAVAFVAFVSCDPEPPPPDDGGIGVEPIPEEDMCWELLS